MKPHLPGLPTFSALMLSAILTVWLGLWGPIDLNKLQPWQPLLVGLFAIVAAIIAYRGATAIVRFNRETRDRDERRKKLGIYLRAEHTCNQLSDRAQSLAEKTRARYLGSRTIDIDELK
ncbi:MAG: hypothetical protein E8A46_28195 [Bradyrhizobium sp.]|jgi:hypothetical protein|uniref:hypothetical protein n=1 Tax=Bradyrhizobium sp. TaxID=376 RepID=UPI0012204721|nr:hypothetical protein [Bradyrhizobium sp.]THD45779.1 MAG: hypothetical protein E8A46_28195 [Bradyrhizobium sp.]